MSDHPTEPVTVNARIPVLSWWRVFALQGLCAISAFLGALLAVSMALDGVTKQTSITFTEPADCPETTTTAICTDDAAAELMNLPECHINSVGRTQTVACVETSSGGSLMFEDTTRWLSMVKK